MNLTFWILPVLLLGIWAQSWWRGSRRFRLWFALLAPFACVVGTILGLLGSVTDSDDTCALPCDGGLVEHWAAGVDSSSGSAAWLGTGSLLALFVAVPLTIVTLIVEYVLLVRRDSADNRR
jgi:H+/Cl- antiporter ClcA